MTAGTSDWDDLLAGRSPQQAWDRLLGAYPGVSQQDAQLCAEDLAARHREDPARRRSVALAAGMVGAGLHSVVDTFLFHPRPTQADAALVVDVVVHVLAFLALAVGLAALVRLGEHRRIVPAWCVGGILGGIGAFSMLDALIDRALVGNLSIQAYLGWEAVSVCVLLLGTHILHRPRFHSR